MSWVGDEASLWPSHLERSPSWASVWARTAGARRRLWALWFGCWSVVWRAGQAACQAYLLYERCPEGWTSRRRMAPVWKLEWRLAQTIGAVGSFTSMGLVAGWKWWCTLQWCKWWVGGRSENETVTWSGRTPDSVLLKQHTYECRRVFLTIFSSTTWYVFFLRTVWIGFEMMPSIQPSVFSMPF